MKMKTELELVRVAFHGDPLYLVTHDGEPYVPMRPVVEGMGLDWASQYVRIRDDERFSVVRITTQMPGDDQRREVVCLPLRKILGWLMTVSPNKVKPMLRERIMQCTRIKEPMNLITLNAERSQGPQYWRPTQI